MAVDEQRPAAKKVDRDEIFLEYTKSICPVCKTVVDAEVNIRDNRVFLRKRCAEHRQFDALVYSDAELYMGQLRFNKPGTLPLEFQVACIADARPASELAAIIGRAGFTVEKVERHDEALERLLEGVEARLTWPGW